MANFLEDLCAALHDEEVEKLIIGDIGWFDEEEHPWAKGTLLDWSEVTGAFDFEYDDGFGGVRCPAVYIWTPTRVLFISQYDGSTNVESVPRHPTVCKPTMPGG